MSNIESYKYVILSEYCRQLFYDGENYILVDDQGRERVMIESEVLAYLMHELTGTYYFERLMITFLQEYVLELIRGNVYRSRHSPSSAA